MALMRQKLARFGLAHRSALPFVLLAIVSFGAGRVSAQPESASIAEQREGSAQTSETPVDEEITVVGQRSRRLLRIEVQLARERVYDLFNSLNSNDDFDITCRSVPRTGTRIPQRVCRPQYTDNATRDAGREFIQRLYFDCEGGILEESCLAGGSSLAQARLSEVPVRDQQLDAEIQRLAQDNPEFRRAVHGFQTAELRYDEARGVAASGVRVDVSMIDSNRAALPSGSSVAANRLAEPEPIELAIPESPWSRTGAGALREGWVKLRFSVLADGTTADLRVVDTMPPGLEASTAVTAAEAWTFEPATAGGTPVDWHNNLAIVTVRREQDVHEGWLGFAEAYEAVAVLAADARFDEAKSRNARMSETAATLEEMAFAEMQLAGLEHAVGDSQAALDAIRRATEPAVDQLADEHLKAALEHRLRLEIELGLAADALASFERWLALDGPSRDAMARLGETLRETLAAPETNLAARGRIGAGEQREHTLTWTTFAVGDVDGQVDGLELVCNRGRAELPFEADVQMTIPAGWGECVLIVAGRPDTDFVVYELRAPIG